MSSIGALATPAVSITGFAEEKATKKVAEAGGSVANSFIRLREAGRAGGWRYIKVKTVDNVYPAKPNEQPSVLSKYGGNTAVRLNATGKFHTENVNGRWWLVDPDGHPFLSCGVNVVRPMNNEKTLKAISDLGGNDVWSHNAVKALKESGFNTAGNWSTRSSDAGKQEPHEGIAYVYYEFGEKSDPELRPGKKPNGLMECFAARLRSLDNQKRGLRFPAFHQSFETFCEERCKRLSRVRDDPWMIGYFTDNELPAPSLEGYLEIDPTDPVYGECGAEARKWWAERGGGTIAAEDSAAWAAHAYEWYYRIVTNAVRRVDPDHLQLGARFYSWERNHESIIAAAGKYLDVVTLNPYGLHALPKSRMNEWCNWAGDRPLMIGEFYVKGADSGDGNSSGAGSVAATQVERGMFYQNYVLSLLQSRVCVGWSWHQYADSTQNTGESALVANKGIVSTALVPYHGLMAAAEKLNRRVYHVVADIDGV